MYIVLKISIKHQAKILGVFTTEDLADQVVVRCHKTDSPNTTLVFNDLGNIYSTRGPDGKLLEDDWYIVEEIPVDMMILDLYVDFFRMSLDKVKFNK